MDYAKEVQSGKVVEATAASSWRSYRCPRPECGGRVYLAQGRIQRTHFRHYPGEGSAACEEYFPSSGSETAPAPHPPVAVEEEPAALGLVLSDYDGQWALCLRVPEVPDEEFGTGALATLRSGLVDVFVGQHRHVQVSALDLRPGVGAMRVPVSPTVQEYRTQPAGTWPATIDRSRWRLRSRGLEAKGTLFRLRNGEWTRLLADSGVREGETLMLIADERCSPPRAVPHSLRAQASSGGMRWMFWEVLLPNDLDAAGRWLSGLGHALVPKPWELSLVVPCREFTADGDPVFWVGDVATIKIDAPSRTAATTTLDRVSDSNRYLTPLETGDDGTTYASVDALRPGPIRLSVDNDALSTIDLHFVERPRSSLLEAVAETPRLRLEVGQRSLRAWDEARYTIAVSLSVPLEVRVDVVYESVRVRVSVWQNDRRHSHRGLSSKEAARVVAEALSANGVSLIEVDADGLGRIEICPSTVSAVRKQSQSGDRLSWRDRVLADVSVKADTNSTAAARHPRVAESPVVGKRASAAWVRTRLELRRRCGRGGFRR